ncbi:MAG: TM2 domain-containing protein [Candidatus Cloacimonas sp.]
MADNKPKRFNPATSNKPLFKPVKGASGDSGTDPNKEVKSLFRAAESNIGKTESPPDRDESKPLFRSVKGADLKTDIPSQEEMPHFRSVGDVAIDPGNDDVESEKPHIDLMELPISKPARDSLNASTKTRQAPQPARPLPETTQPANDPDISPKSGITTLLLCLFLGFYGGHRFYSGHTGLGILYLFTAGLFMIGWIVDLISILSGRYRDKDNKLIRL